MPVKSTKAARSAGPSTRNALLDAGVVVAERSGLGGLSVNQVVAEAGVAKGTFYVHFQDRETFVDALHERFLARVQEAVGEMTDGLSPGADRLVAGAEAYLNACLQERAIKALALEARTDPALNASMTVRHDRFAAAAAPNFKAMGWPDSTAAAQLFAAMAAEIAIRELDAGKKLPAARRSLRRFVGSSSPS